MAGQLFNLKRYFGAKPDDQPNSYQVDSNAMQQPPPQYPPQQGYPPMGYPQQPQVVQPNQGYYPNDGMNFPSLVDGMQLPGGATLTQQPYPQQQMPMQPQQPMPQAPVPPPMTTPAAPMAPDKREDVSMLTHFSQRLNIAITQAATESTRIKSAFIEPEQILFGLLFDSSIFKIIQDLGSSAAQIQEEIKQTERMGIANGTPQFSETVKSLLAAAEADAKKRNEESITPEHVLFAIVENGNTPAAQILVKNKVTKEAIEKRLTTDKPLMQTNQTSALEEYGVDITKKAKEGKLDPIVARDKEIERTMHILSRRTKNNPVLIGEPGVGKTAIVEGLAEKIVSGQVPSDLRDKRIVGLDLTAIIAGASHRGEFEERIKKLIKELQASNGEIILFIDEIHNLVGAGGGDGAMNASNILKPFLARGEIQLIGTTTIDEYRRYIEKDPALERRFQQVQVDEPSIEDAIEMLKVLRKKYEDFHHVQIPDDAIENAVKLSKRYIGDRFLPDKAIDLIDEAASRIKLTAKEGQHPAVTKEDIEQIVASWTGIPVTKLTEKEGERLLNLEKLIHQRMIDQEGAVNAIAEAVRRGRAGLKSTNRPIGSFLFLGPTGVGKTELAKTLAEVLFGSDTLMIRLDMTEYMEKHEVAKLIGAPPGYVGYEEGGQLTEAVRTKPYSVVLLDEVEKAHPDVFNILLQILDDGRLTDNKGRTISFKNTIIIATSNAGTSLIQKEDLAGNADQVIHMGNKQSNSAKPPTKFELLAQKLLAELMKFFKPEILNRFDEIIVFKPLTQEHMMSIAKINFKNTAKLLAEQKLGIEVSEAALRKIAEIGFDPVFGARPLRRAIQTEVENPISTQIIERKYQEGDTIVVDYDAVKATFVFTKKNPQPVQNGQPLQQYPQQPGQPMQQMHPMSNGMPPQPMQPQAPNGMAQPMPHENPFTSIAQPTQPAAPQIATQQTSDLYAKINGNADTTHNSNGYGMGNSDGTSPLPTSNTMSNGVVS